MNTRKIKTTRKLIIKNPKLQAIRHNFRIIIQLAVQDELNRLMDLDSLYLEKRRLSKKDLTSHYKRGCQLNAMKEYLLTTYSNSICVSSCVGRISDSITGDRVRYSFITEIDKCFIKSYGAHYLVEEKWFSLKYYEENYEFLEKYLKKMKTQLKQSPGRVIDILEVHERRVREIQHKKREYLEELLLG